MNTMTTICGGDKYLRTFQLSDGSITNCMIYDTAGQERFDSLNFTYFKKADAILLVYDISDRNSFEKIKNVYVQEIKDRCKENIPILLLGNKTDKEDQRQISYEEGIELALEEDYEFQESSCIKNINVAGAFEVLIERWNFEYHRNHGQIKKKNSDDKLKKSLTSRSKKEMKRINSERNISTPKLDKKKENKGRNSIKLTRESLKPKPKKGCC